VTELVSIEIWDERELSCEKVRAEAVTLVMAARGDGVDVRQGREARRSPEAVEATRRERDAIVWVDGEGRAERVSWGSSPKKVTMSTEHGPSRSLLSMPRMG